MANRGEFETELGFGYLSEAGSRELVAPQLVLNLGIFSRWEAVLEGRGLIPLESEPASPRFRLNDTGLFFKGLLREGSLQEGTGPSIATEFGVLLPTLNGESGVGASAALIASQHWEPLTVHLNGQGQLTRAGNLGLFGGLILEGPTRWVVRPVGEVFLASEGGRSRIASGLVGAIWTLGDNFSLDLAARAQRGDLVAYEVRLGFTWGIRLWGKA